VGGAGIADIPKFLVLEALGFLSRNAREFAVGGEVEFGR